MRCAVAIVETLFGFELSYLFLALFNVFCNTKISSEG